MFTIYNGEGKGLTLTTLKEIKEAYIKYDYIPYPVELFIWKFANLYTNFDLFIDALNYVIAVLSKDKTNMPVVVPVVII